MHACAFMYRFGVLGGFETGNAIKENGVYHLFYGEKADPTTYPVRDGELLALGVVAVVVATEDDEVVSLVCVCVCVCVL